MEGLPVSTPENHDPDQTPQQDQSQPDKGADPASGEKKAEPLGDPDAGKIVVSSDDEKKRGWKGIG